jgi:hypothetical protein
MSGDHIDQFFFRSNQETRAGSLICVCDGTPYKTCSSKCNAYFASVTAWMPPRPSVVSGRSAFTHHGCIFVGHCVDTWRIRLCWLVRRYVMNAFALFGSTLARNKLLFFGRYVDTSQMHLWIVLWHITNSSFVLGSMMTHHEYVFSGEFIDTSGVPLLWAARWHIRNNFIIVQECLFVGEYVETSRMSVCCTDGTRERFSGHL